jgi:hypothetical protein
VPPTIALAKECARGSFRLQHDFAELARRRPIGGPLIPTYRVAVVSIKADVGASTPSSVHPDDDLTDFGTRGIPISSSSRERLGGANRGPFPDVSVCLSVPEGPGMGTNDLAGPARRRAWLARR